MQVDDRAKETLAKLAVATREGRVAWERACRVPTQFAAEHRGAALDGSNDFACTVGGYCWTVTRRSPPAAPDYFQVWLERIRTVPGGYGEEEEFDLVYTHRVEDGSYDERALELLTELWTAAHRSATGWDEAFEQVDAALEAAA